MKKSNRVLLLLEIAGAIAAAIPRAAPAQSVDDLVFIHHSVGQDWLDNGLRQALLDKTYIDEVNEITYGTTLSPDTGRPESLGSTPGDNTDMWHWILWFNDYLEGIRAHDCDNGANRIVMFKSCYPNSDLFEDGTEPGDPFRDWQVLVDYMALYRHPGGSGNTYTHDSYTYWPLEDIFAANPDVLFIPITSPSRIPPETCSDWADRCRVFHNWLKNTWLPAYNAAHPNLRNVAVFDFFDVLAYANDFTGTEHYTPMGGSPEGDYPVRNMTKTQYRTGDSHPNAQADQDATAAFATASSSFLDAAHDAWHGVSTAAPLPWSLYP